MWREGKYDGLSIDAQRADKTGLEEKAGQAAATTEEAHGYPLYTAGPGQQRERGGGPRWQRLHGFCTGLKCGSSPVLALPRHLRNISGRENSANPLEKPGRGERIRTSGPYVPNVEAIMFPLCSV